MRLLRANVIRARTDGCIKGRIYLTQSDLPSEAETLLQRRGSPYIRLDSRSGFCDFAISSAGINWRGRYEIGGTLFKNLDSPPTTLFVQQGDRETDVEDYLAAFPPTFYRNDLSRIEGTSLYPHRGAVVAFSPERIQPIDWTAAGIDIESEKQNTTRGRSIFAWVLDRCRASGDTFVFCDDGAGEMADFISISLDMAAPKVRFFHCKASGRSVAGARQEDFFELCGQALRNSIWFASNA